VHDSFTFDLLLLSAEQKPGPHVISSTRPASCLRTEQHRLYSEKALAAAHPIYGELICEINRERRRQLLINLNNHPVEQYVCIKCLEDYIRQSEDPVEKGWRIEHIRNAMRLIREFDLFRFYLVSECSSFIFVLKTPVDAESDSEKLVITVLPPHRTQIRTSGLLAGFATDSHAVISNFKKELQFIQNAVIGELSDRKRLIAYLEKLIA
jgi:hypothetical protein